MSDPEYQELDKMYAEIEGMRKYIKERMDPPDKRITLTKREYHLVKGILDRLKSAQESIFLILFEDKGA